MKIYVSIYVQTDLNPYRYSKTLVNAIYKTVFKLTFNGILEVPISSLSCFPVDAVIAISFINLRRPLTPFTSNIFVIFSLTVSAGSKSLK